MNNEKYSNDEGRSKVKLNESWEVNYWTRIFKSSRRELADAIKEVGNSPDKVKDYLQSLHEKDNLTD